MQANLRSLQAMFECPICLERLKAPKVLSCFHSLCSVCVMEYVSSKRYGATLICPTCRQATNLPHPGGVAGAGNLPVNSYVSSLMDIVAATCDLKLTDNPETTVTDSLVSGARIAADDSQASKCSRHATKDTQLYCDSCTCLICVECVVTTCKQHNHKSLEDAASAARRELTQMAVKIGNCVSSLKTQTEAARVQSRKMAEQKKSCLGQLEQRRNKIQSAVASAHAAAVQRVNHQISKWENEAQAISERTKLRHASVDKLLGDIGHVISRASDRAALCEVATLERKVAELMNMGEQEEFSLPQHNIFLAQSKESNVSAAIKKCFGVVVRVPAKSSKTDSEQPKLPGVRSASEPAVTIAGGAVLSKKAAKKLRKASLALGAVPLSTVHQASPLPAAKLLEQADHCFSRVPSSSNATQLELLASGGFPQLPASFAYPPVYSSKLQCPSAAAIGSPQHYVASFAYPPLPLTSATTLQASLSSIVYPQPQWNPAAVDSQAAGAPWSIVYPTRLATGETQGPYRPVSQQQPTGAKPEPGSQDKSSTGQTTQQADDAKQQATKAKKSVRKSIGTLLKELAATVGGTGETVGPKALKILKEAEVDEATLRVVVQVIFGMAAKQPELGQELARVCKHLISVTASQCCGQASKVTNFKKLLQQQCQNELECKNAPSQGSTSTNSPPESSQQSPRQPALAAVPGATVVGAAGTAQKVQFIVSLCVEGLLAESVLHDCIIKCLKESEEDCLEYGCGLLAAHGRTLDTKGGKPRMNQHFNQIKRVISLPTTPTRIVMMLQHIVILRENNWTVR